MKWIKGFLVAYPLALPLVFYSTWLVGRLSLGYWPRPSFDDPKEISAATTLAHCLSYTFFVVGLSAFVVFAAYALGTSLFRKPRNPYLALWVCGSVGLLLAAVFFLRWDPHSVMMWLAD